MECVIKQKHFHSITQSLVPLSLYLPAAHSVTLPFILLILRSSWLTPSQPFPPPCIYGLAGPLCSDLTLLHPALPFVVVQSLGLFYQTHTARMENLQSELLNEERRGRQVDNLIMLLTPRKLLLNYYHLLTALCSLLPYMRGVRVAHLQLCLVLTTSLY